MISLTSTPAGKNEKLRRIQYLKTLFDIEIVKHLYRETGMVRRAEFNLSFPITLQLLEDLNLD